MTQAWCSRQPQFSPVQRLPPELIEFIARQLAAEWDDDFHARLHGGSASGLAERAQEASKYCLVCRSWDGPFRREMWRSVNLNVAHIASPFWLGIAQGREQGSAPSYDIQRLAVTGLAELQPTDLAVVDQLRAALFSVQELNIVGQDALEIWFGRSPGPLHFPRLVSLSLVVYANSEQPEKPAYIYCLAAIPTLRQLKLTVIDKKFIPALRRTELNRPQYLPARILQRIPLDFLSFQWVCVHMIGDFTAMRALDEVFHLDELKRIELAPPPRDSPNVMKLDSFVNLEYLTITAHQRNLLEYTVAIDATLAGMRLLKQLRIIRDKSLLAYRYMDEPPTSLSPCETTRLLQALPATLQDFQLEISFPAVSEAELLAFLVSRRPLPLIHFDASLEVGHHTEVYAWDKDREREWVRRGDEGPGAERWSSYAQLVRARSARATGSPQAR